MGGSKDPITITDTVPFYLPPPPEDKPKGIYEMTERQSKLFNLQKSMNFLTTLAEAYEKETDLFFEVCPSCIFEELPYNKKLQNIYNHRYSIKVLMEEIILKEYKEECVPISTCLVLQRYADLHKTLCRNRI